MQERPPGKDPEDLQRILRCGKCGKTVACPPSEMLAYTVTGWPKCCGETMALFTYQVFSPFEAGLYARHTRPVNGYPAPSDLPDRRSESASEGTTAKQRGSGGPKRCSSANPTPATARFRLPSARPDGPDRPGVRRFGPPPLRPIGRRGTDGLAPQCGSGHGPRVTSAQTGARIPHGPRRAGRNQMGRVRHRVGVERFSRLRPSGKVSDDVQRIASPIPAALTARLPS